VSINTNDLMLKDFMKIWTWWSYDKLMKMWKLEDLRVDQSLDCVLNLCFTWRTQNLKI